MAAAIVSRAATVARTILPAHRSPHRRAAKYALSGGMRLPRRVLAHAKKKQGEPPGDGSPAFADFSAAPSGRQGVIREVSISRERKGQAAAWPLPVQRTDATKRVGYFLHGVKSGRLRLASRQ